MVGWKIPPVTEDIKEMRRLNVLASIHEYTGDLAGGLALGLVLLPRLGRARRA